jgi:hypothetical protein
MGLRRKKEVVTEYYVTWIFTIELFSYIVLYAFSTSRKCYLVKKKYFVKREEYYVIIFNIYK